MAYIDCYIIPVPKDRLDDYWKMAELGRTVWLEHGALTYSEALADDAPVGETTSFPRAVQLKDDEAVIVGHVTYRDRAHRDAVNARVMADPRLKMDMSKMPFDGKRLIFGGFEVKVAG